MGTLFQTESVRDMGLRLLYMTRNVELSFHVGSPFEHPANAGNQGSSRCDLRYRIALAALADGIHDGNPNPVTFAALQSDREPDFLEITVCVQLVAVVGSLLGS